ncbi:MAG: flagellar biosynthesis anti-sigma factor FlgM [Parasphingorhabdus sp.]|uniref:flagellar biosynthesis anti-sigma factor FlgM n=1 Tax=Parasphingorhabdus sp. TaxID=2709688 RepID=UPI0032997D58
MKPVESYTAINTRLDRSVLQDGASNKVTAGAEAGGGKNTPAITTTASILAAQNPPFDEQKVAEVRQKIASGIYSVDTAALAQKMLDMGVFGLGTEQ